MMAIRSCSFCRGEGERGEGRKGGRERGGGRKGEMEWGGGGL